MKTRQSFVANSSSSSFICDLCGETFEGMDACPSDFEHYTCVNEHIFCSEGLIGERNDGCSDYYEVPEENCPFCQFLHFAEGEMAQFLQARYKVDRAVVFAQVKELNKRRKKLYNHEYIDYVYRNCNTTSTQEEDYIRATFKTFTEFSEWYRKENRK